MLCPRRCLLAARGSGWPGHCLCRSHRRARCRQPCHGWPGTTASPLPHAGRGVVGPAVGRGTPATQRAGHSSRLASASPAAVQARAALPRPVRAGGLGLRPVRVRAGRLAAQARSPAGQAAACCSRAARAPPPGTQQPARHPPDLLLCMPGLPCLAHVRAGGRGLRPVRARQAAGGLAVGPAEHGGAGGPAVLPHTPGPRPHRPQPSHGHAHGRAGPGCRGPGVWGGAQPAPLGRASRYGRRPQASSPYYRPALAVAAATASSGGHAAAWCASRAGWPGTTASLLPHAGRGGSGLPWARAPAAARVVPPATPCPAARSRPGLRSWWAAGPPASPWPGWGRAGTGAGMSCGQVLRGVPAEAVGPRPTA